MIGLILICVILGVIAIAMTFAIMDEVVDSHISGKHALLVLVLVWSAFTIVTGMTYMRHKKMESRQQWEATR